jgi:hypothetical protein
VGSTGIAFQYADKVNSLWPNRRLLIALHSPLRGNRRTHRYAEKSSHDIFAQSEHERTACSRRAGTIGGTGGRSTISESEGCYCIFAYSGFVASKIGLSGSPISPECEPTHGCRYPLNCLRRSQHFSCCRPLTTSGREVRIDYWSTSHRSRRPPSDCRI